MNAILYRNGHWYRGQRPSIRHAYDDLVEAVPADGDEVDWSFSYPKQSIPAARLELAALGLVQDGSRLVKAK